MDLGLEGVLLTRLPSSWYVTDVPYSGDGSAWHGTPRPGLNMVDADLRTG
jgi:hypothetical protein